MHADLLRSPDVEIPPFRSLPQWRWHDEFPLAVISLLVSGILILVDHGIGPDFFGHYGPQVALFLVGVALAYPALNWLYRLVSSVAGRLRDYSTIHALAGNVQEDLVHIRSFFFELLHSVPELRILEVQKAAYVNEEIYVTLRKPDEPRVDVDDYLALMDFSDGMALGVLRITEIRTDEYFAVAERGMDPVFRGRVIQQQEVGVMPYIMAMHVAREDCVKLIVYF